MSSINIYSDHFLDNKYSKAYLKIVHHRQNNLHSSDVYTEKHHIIPKSIGGQNRKQNLLIVSAREHFILHWLLTKMCHGQQKYKMLEAFSIFQNNKNRSLRLTSRKVQSIREANAIASSIRNMGNQHWKSRGPTTPELLQRQKDHSSKCKWINDGISEKFEIDHEEYTQTGGWTYGRLKREKEKAPYKRLACNHCNRTLTAHNHRLFHGDNCKQNPANVHALEEKLRKAEEKKLREKLKRLQQKNETSLLKCVHCGYGTRDQRNFSRWHGDKCKDNPSNARISKAKPKNR